MIKELQSESLGLPPKVFIGAAKPIFGGVAERKQGCFLEFGKHLL